MSLPNDGSDQGTYNIAGGTVVNYANIELTSNTSNAAFKSYFISSLTASGQLLTSSPGWITGYPNIVTTYLP